jgi:hypothetical protein
MAEPLTGYCTGGPLDGREVSVRTPTFLAVDRPAAKSWVYQHTGDGFQVVVDHDDSLIYPEGARTGERRFDPDRGWRAGLESSLDIVAVSD